MPERQSMYVPAQNVVRTRSFGIRKEEEQPKQKDKKSKIVASKRGLRKAKAQAPVANAYVASMTEALAAGDKAD